jgi:hypothetical protein
LLAIVTLRTQGQFFIKHIAQYIEERCCQNLFAKA